MVSVAHIQLLGVLQLVNHCAAVIAIPGLSLSINRTEAVQIISYQQSGRPCRLVSAKPSSVKCIQIQSRTPRHTVCVLRLPPRQKALPEEIFDTGQAVPLVFVPVIVSDVIACGGIVIREGVYQLVEDILLRDRFLIFAMCKVLEQRLLLVSVLRQKPRQQFDLLLARQ